MRFTPGWMLEANDKERECTLAQLRNENSQLAKKVQILESFCLGQMDQEDRRTQRLRAALHAANQAEVSGQAVVEAGLVQQIEGDSWGAQR